MWFGADVIGLLSLKVVLLSVQCGPRALILSAIVVPKRPMLSGRKLDVIGSLHLGFAVPVTGIKTTGVVRCDQPRVIDLATRHARKVDTLPAPIMDEVLAKVVTLFE